MTQSQLLVHSIQNATVVNFRTSAMLDSNVIEAIGAELFEMVDQRAQRQIVLDCSKVQFLASQAIGVLITLKKKADAIGGRVAICGMRDEIRRVFKIMNLQTLFKFYKDEAEALASFDIFSA